MSYGDKFYGDKGKQGGARSEVGEQVVILLQFYMGVTWEVLTKVTFVQNLKEVKGVHGFTLRR